VPLYTVEVLAIISFFIGSTLAIKVHNVLLYFMAPCPTLFLINYIFEV
jgi:hypothetical protein